MSVRSTSIVLLFRVATDLGLIPRYPTHPTAKHLFNSTLAKAKLQEQSFNAARSGMRFLLEGQGKEKSLPLYPLLAVGALNDRQDLVILGFAERDYFDVRDWV